MIIKIIFDTFFITLFFIIIFILGINEKQIEVKRDEIGEMKEDNQILSRNHQADF